MGGISIKAGVESKRSTESGEGGLVVVEAVYVNPQTAGSHILMLQVITRHC